MTELTLPARVASIEKASGDLVILLERITETVTDRRELDANREATVENLQLALSYARRIREAIS
jgi:adenylate kinase